jgi:hypothetical protein
MPCSPKYIDVSQKNSFLLFTLFSLLIKKDNRTIWARICQWLQHLKAKCEGHSAKFEDLKVMIIKLLFYWNKRNITLEHN